MSKTLSIPVPYYYLLLNRAQIKKYKFYFSFFFSAKKESSQFFIASRAWACLKLFILFFFCLFEKVTPRVASSWKLQFYGNSRISLSLACYFFREKCPWVTLSQKNQPKWSLLLIFSNLIDRPSLSFKKICNEVLADFRKIMKIQVMDL